jgi:hypothetical protein
MHERLKTVASPTVRDLDTANAWPVLVQCLGDDPLITLPSNRAPDNQEAILQTIGDFLEEYAPAVHHGRAVARILAAIPSPRYPAGEWYRSPFWGKHATVDFEWLTTTAQAALRAVRTR